MILSKISVYLGPLKSSKNMLSLSILIGLFVLKNDRTIGEPKHVHVSFLGRLRAAREIEMGFRSGGYGQQSMSSQWVNH